MHNRNSPNFRHELDYYNILGVSESSSGEEIRRAYRRLVLDAHPDKNPHRREWAEHRIRLLIEAFDILGNEDSRRVFDIHRKAAAKMRGEGEPFFFTRNTPGARALLVLYLLTNKQEEKGAQLLVEMEEEYGSEYLREYLCREDYLDSLFLLAEYYIRQKNFLAAAERLRVFYHHECHSSSPRHYYSQVLDHLRNLYLRKLPGILAPGLLSTYLAEAADFQLKQNDEVLRLHLLARAAMDSENFTVAQRALESFNQLNPASSELQELRSRLAQMQDVSIVNRKVCKQGAGVRGGL